MPTSVLSSASRLQAFHITFSPSLSWSIPQEQQVQSLTFFEYCLSNNLPTEHAPDHPLHPFTLPAGPLIISFFLVTFNPFLNATLEAYAQRRSTWII
jgi:hypothetical protein